MSNKLGGRQGTSYLGTNAESPPNWTFHTDSPTIYNSQNFSLGDMWLNTTLQDAFVLTSLAFNPVSNVREAVWFQFANGPQTGTINQLIAADGTIANPLNGQITFPNAVITANTNPVSNILTSVQPNNGSDFLINLTPQINLRNDVNGVDSITLEQISVSGGAWNSTLKFLRADGTIAAPTAVSNNFGLGSIRWFGYTGSGYTGAPSAAIKSLVKGAVVDNANPALSAVPACIAFAVSETQLTAPFDLNSLDIKLQIDPDGQVYVKRGNLVINTPPTALNALTVNGFNTAGTYAQQNIAVTPGAQFSAFRAFNNTVTAGSSCMIECSVSSQAAATGGDPYLRFVNYGVQGIAIGLDTSVNQFNMSSGNIGDGDSFYTYDVATSQINKPKQCTFFAQVSAPTAAVTGDGTLYTVLFDQERFDVSGSYVPGTGVFTAPKTGKYLFSGSLRLSGLSAAMTYAQVVLVNTTPVIGDNLLFGISNVGASRSVAGVADNICIPFSTIIAMDAGSISYVQLGVFGGALAVLVEPNSSFFSGQLLS